MERRQNDDVGAGPISGAHCQLECLALVKVGGRCGAVQLGGAACD